MPPIFKIAGLENVPDILRLMVAFNREGGYPADPVRTEKLLAEFLADISLGRAWLISLEGQIVGYLVICHCFSFEHGGRDAFLDEIYVVPEFRRQGLGREALAYAQKYCVEADIRVLHLEVEPGNDAARDLYEKSGFTDPRRPLMTWRG